MNDKIMVSVAVSFYNQERFIDEALTSVLNQKTNFDYEIVIGEDCSSDNTRSILEQYRNKYPNKIRVFYNPKNLGVVLNVKNILDNCQGKYIALLGGDDFFLSKEKLQKQFDFLETNLDYGFVHSDVQLLIEENGQEPKIVDSGESYFNLKIRSGDIYEDLLQKSYVMACTAFFRRDIYTQNADLGSWHQLGFQMEDWPMWLSFSRVTKFAYLKEPLATYRILANTLSRLKDPVKSANFWLSSTKVSFYFLDKYGASDSVRKRVSGKNYRYYLEYALERKDKAVAQEAFNYFQGIGEGKFVYRWYYWGASNQVAWFLLKVFRKFFKSLQINAYN